MIEQQIAELNKEIRSLNQGISVFAKRFEDAVAKMTAGMQPPAEATSMEPVEDAPNPPMEADPKETSASLNDVRQALIDHKTAHGREATLGLLKRYVPEGAQLIVGNVAKDKYAALIADVRGA